MEKVIRRVISQGFWPKVTSRDPIAFDPASVRSYSNELYKGFSSSRSRVSFRQVLSSFTALIDHARKAGDSIGASRNHPGMSAPFFLITLARSLRVLPEEKRRVVYEALNEKVAGAATDEITPGLKSNGVSHSDLNKVLARFNKLSQAMKNGFLSHIARLHGVKLSRQDLTLGATALDHVSPLFPQSAQTDLELFTNFQHYCNTGSTGINWLQVFANKIKQLE